MEFWSSVVEYSFEKLRVYQHARAYRVRIYKLSKLLPAAEYKLKIQMRDAARSLTNNLAEGQGRYTYRDRKRFCVDARASLQELADDINLCMDEDYAQRAHLEDLKADGHALLVEINGFIKYLRRKDLAGAANVDDGPSASDSI